MIFCFQGNCQTGVKGEKGERGLPGMPAPSSESTLMNFLLKLNLIKGYQLSQYK